MVVSKTSLPLIKQNNMSVKRLHRDEPLIHQLNYIYAHEQKELIRIDLTKYKKKKRHKNVIRNKLISQYKIVMLSSYHLLVYTCINFENIAVL